VLRPLFSSSSLVQPSPLVTRQKMSSSLMAVLSATMTTEAGFWPLLYFLYAAALCRGWFSQSVQRALCRNAFKKEGIYWGVVTSIFRLVMSIVFATTRHFPSSAALILLHFRRLPQNVQTVVCSAYSESRYYWGAVTLLFRLGMSIMFTTLRDTPSTAALLQCFLCMAMIMLLMHQKPYCHAATYLFDIFCHAILVVQFGLMAIGTVSDSLGLVPQQQPILWHFE
jgi:hypothetical protein